jgi:malate dehydrogenase (oxaloacetate-decarboxylating)
LGVPVLHDDQHTTAVAVLAALLNATRQTGATLDALTVGVIGLGAAGLGIARLLQAHGVRHLLGTDLRVEAIGRLAQLRGHRESLEGILARADAVICTTGAKQLIAPERIRAGQIIFALSNPDPEIDPGAALAAGAAVAADGTSISSVLSFPGLLDGALRTRARARVHRCHVRRSRPSTRGGRALEMVRASKAPQDVAQLIPGLRAQATGSGWTTW